MSILGSDTTIAVEGLFAVGLHKQITIHSDVSFGYVHGVRNTYVTRASVSAHNVAYYLFYTCMYTTQDLRSRNDFLHAWHNVSDN